MYLKNEFIDKNIILCNETIKMYAQEKFDKMQKDKMKKDEDNIQKHKKFNASDGVMNSKKI